MSQRFLAGLLAMTAGLSMTPALAADLGAETVEAPVAVEATTRDGWIVTLKATAALAPEFEAADAYGVTLFPAISLRRPGQPWKFGAPDDGFGFAAFDTPWFQIGPVARLRGERDSGDVKKFRGMHDVDWAIEPGAFLEFYPYEKIRVRAELRHGFWGHDGFVGNVSADWIERFEPVTISFGPRLEIGDDDFMNAYFGVSARDAARNGRVRPYKADAGIKSVGAAAALTYDWTRSWSTTALASYNRLVGDAADSPVARRLGSRHAFAVGLGVAYAFDWGN